MATVTRRFPNYDFVIQTNRSVVDNGELLESYLKDQKRPKGFALTDDRLVGGYDGSVFNLRPVSPPFGGAWRSVIEGYFVPRDSGSDVVVRVRNPTITLVFVAFLLVVFLGGSLGAGFFTFEGLGVLLLVVLFLFAITFLPVIAEGHRVAKILAKVFGTSNAAV